MLAALVMLVTAVIAHKPLKLVKITMNAVRAMLVAPLLCQPVLLESLALRLCPLKIACLVNIV